jgi:hypothetical protein
VSFMIIFPMVSLCGAAWFLSLALSGYTWTPLPPLIYTVFGIVVVPLVACGAISVDKGAAFMLFLLQLLPAAMHFIGVSLLVLLMLLLLFISSLL